MGYFMRWTIKRVTPASKAGSNARSELNGRVIDGFTNIHAVKMFAHDAAEVAYVQDVMNATRKSFYRLNRIETIMNVMLWVLNGMLVVGVTGGGLDQLSLTIQPGEKIGLVGRSGAGKSTLFKLLLRFYDAESGHILIDGQDIAAVTQDSLRAQIGMVQQDSSLLHRSLRTISATGAIRPVKPRLAPPPHRPKRMNLSAICKTLKGAVAMMPALASAVSNCRAVNASGSLWRR